MARNTRLVGAQGSVRNVPSGRMLRDWVLFSTMEKILRDLASILLLTMGCQLSGMADSSFIDSRQACVSDNGGQGRKLKPSTDPITKVSVGTDAV